MYLQPLVKNSSSYVKDTGAFVEIPGLDKDDIISSLDVPPLCTNIPNDEGIEVIRETLKEKRKGIQKPPNEAFCTLLEVVLKNNNFLFNGNNYLQIGGTAMGTALAPAYANLFMRKLEEEFFNKEANKPYIWKRYIDDIFFHLETWRKSPT